MNMVRVEKAGDWPEFGSSDVLRPRPGQSTMRGSVLQTFRDRFGIHRVVLRSDFGRRVGEWGQGERSCGLWIYRRQKWGMWGT